MSFMSLLNGGRTAAVIPVPQGSVKSGSTPSHPHAERAPGLEVINMTKRFGSLVALDNVSMKLQPGTFNALLGGNGAGKSTLVKCIMGYYQADEGQVVLGHSEVVIRNPREARVHGIGMVYQHFTLVPNMTVAENLVLSRGDVPAVVDWSGEIRALGAFMETTPFRLKLDVPVRSLAAGEKQKLEIIKQLYLRNKVLFLDEPTSVLTPQEADEVLGMLHAMTREGKLTVLTITHKFREVMKFADEVTVLRLGKFAGGGGVRDLTPAVMAEMMIGSEQPAKPAARSGTRGAAKLTINNLNADDETGVPALSEISMEVHGGEIVGIAGVSGNGQSELVEVLAGQRKPTGGTVRVLGEAYMATRSQIRRLKVHCLPEEPLKNTCVPAMSVAQNMAFRTFDRPPSSAARVLLSGGSIRKTATELIARYRVKTPTPETPIRELSGGNIQRAVLARELCEGVDVLIAANPCFGLDFAAAADIRSQITAARNRGTAVLLVSEDLDEVLELSDRVLVMFDGKLVYETPGESAEVAIIGRHMAGHAEAHT